MCKKTNNTDVSAADLALVKILKKKFKKVGIDLNKITTYNCHLSDFTDELKEKEIQLGRGVIFGYQLKKHNVRVIDEASLMMKNRSNKIYENIVYIIEIATPSNRKGYIRYNSIFDNPLTKIKKIRFHTEGIKYNNINSLILSREVIVYKNKRTIFKIVNGLK